MMHKYTERLRKLKAQHNLTGKDIAEKTGVKPNTAMIWQMEDSPRIIPFAKLYDLEVKLNGYFRSLD